MNSPVIQDFAASLPLDNNLLLADVIAGAPVSPSEVLSLAAIANSLFISACHESRSIDLIDKHRELWTQVSELFDELTQAWSNVDSGEESILWLRGRLQHFASLARDRMEFYKISMAERVAHSKKRGDIDIEPFSVRNSVEPDGYSSSSGPAHIYSCSLP